MAGLNAGHSAGEVLELIASGSARTRSAISQRTGLSRATVAERLDVLFRAQLIREGEEAASTGGRPSRTLTISDERHLVLAADVGEDHVRVVVADLTGRVLAEHVGELAVSAGADRVVGWILDTGLALVDGLARHAADVIGVALSLPAPVDWARGTVASPSVMGPWEGRDLKALVRDRLDVTVVVENDVNARGYGEFLTGWADRDDMFYVKAGTGIGSAILSHGALLRGSRGAAGDIGHLRVEPQTGPRCRCGAVGCVEALAAGWSLVRDLRAAGYDVSETRQAMGLVERGDPLAVHLLREAGRTLGRAIAYSVNLLNPSLVVVGGSLASAGEHLLLGVREAVCSSSPTLATSGLRIVAGRGGEQCGAVGAAALVAGQILTADHVNSHLRRVS